MSQTKAQLINAVDGSIVDADITGLSSSKLSGALPAISGAALTNLDAGKILQVKQTVKTSFFSTSTTGSGVDVTGVSVTITPASSSNKILVRCFGEYGNDNNDSFASLSIARVLDGSTDTGIAVGDARGSTTRATMNAPLRSGGGLSHNVSRHFGCEFLDSPNTTNAIIYKDLNSKKCRGRGG